MKEHFIVHDEKMFFNILRTTHSIEEALELARDAREAVLRIKEKARNAKRTHEAMDWDRLLTRLADEIKRLNRVADETDLRHAIEAILGKDALVQVLSWQAKVRSLKIPSA
jgi:hypothetical protein